MMRLKAIPSRVVSVSVVERVYDPGTKKTGPVKGTSRTLTLHETTADEVWRLIYPVIAAAAEDGHGAPQ